jgi:2-oxoisovalerate ferredoxin oxidoreductase beta subunit
MTGGQVAPTTLIGQKSTTTPGGRSVANEGYPLHVCELLATLEAPVYIERVTLGDNKQIVQAARAIRRAVENQVRGLGFSLIEVLSPCPTIWKMSPVEAQHWVRDVMEKTFPLGVFRDRTKEAQPRPLPALRPRSKRFPAFSASPMRACTRPLPLASPSRKKWICTCASPASAARACLLLGEVLAEAGLDAGLEVSWLPSYGPEMRSGTSNCHVRVASQPIDSPLVTLPNVLVAMNEPSLRKFDATVRPGGWVLYNGDTFPTDCERPDVHVLALPFTHLADELGDARASQHDHAGRAA